MARTRGTPRLLTAGLLDLGFWSLGFGLYPYLGSGFAVLYGLGVEDRVRC